MNDDDVLDQHFPGAAQRLSELRLNDQELDGICSDYLDLFDELSQAPRRKGDLTPRYLADLAESLSDLRHEIEVRLNAAGEHRQRSHNEREGSR